MKKPLDQFDWGNTNQEYIQLFTNENLILNTYEQHCPVKSGDIVFDIGANCGSFAYSILDKNPKHIYCVEPSNTLIHSLRNNVGDGPVTLINKAIGDENCENKTIAENGVFIYQNDGDVYSTITLKQLIKENNISKIDFLKFDCEGGEYSIFTKENYNFIKNHVVHFSGEWHINDHENSIERFIEFRNLYLQDYKELYVYDRTGKEITQDIFNDEYLHHFREYWKETYIGQFIIYVTYEQNKLTNFPPVYYVSLSDSIDRQQAFEKQFLLNGIENVKMIEAYDGRKDDYRYKPDIVDGFHFETLDSGGIAATISHLKAIIEWYNNSDSDYAIFFEDDMSIESANDWNFTWDEFISSLPENWKAIQLSLIKDNITHDDMKLNQRVWWNWSAGSYLIRRNYAKELIDYFYQNEKYYLKIKGEENTIPCIEHCLFSLGTGDVYTIPLFYENINFVSTFYQHFIQKTHKDLQIDSSNYVKYWWKIAGLNKSLDDFKLSFSLNQINQTFKMENMGLRVVQIGSNKGNDELSEYIFNNYENIEFGLFVEANSFHIEELKQCYEKYKNVNIENIAIKTPSQKQDSLTFYYHTNEHPHYSITTCDIKHLEKHMSWCPHLQGGEVKSFETSCITLDELFQKYKVDELDILFLDVEGLDAEILLTFDWKKYSIKRIEFESLHLGEYSNSIKYMMIGMGYDQVESLHQYNWAFEKKEFISQKDKLKNFPSVNFISIEESEDRRKVLYQQFEKYGITNITPHIYKKYRDEEHKIIEGPLVNHNGKGPVTSHLKAIKEWYENTDEPYTLFCEDDLSLDTVKYWNFTWDEFFTSLPENWNIVQLCLIREDMFIFFNPEVKLRHRFLCDWSACAYLITRKHAENLIKNYYPDDYIHLEYKGIDKEFRENESSSFWFLLPQVENMVYSSFGGGNFVFPLFVENIFEPTWRDDDTWINKKCRNEILEWWDLKGSNKTLNDLML